MVVDGGGDGNLVGGPAALRTHCPDNGPSVRPAVIVGIIMVGIMAVVVIITVAKVINMVTDVVPRSPSSPQSPLLSFSV